MNCETRVGLSTGSWRLRISDRRHDPVRYHFYGIRRELRPFSFITPTSARLLSHLLKALDLTLILITVDYLKVDRVNVNVLL